MTLTSYIVERLALNAQYVGIFYFYVGVDDVEVDGQAAAQHHQLGAADAHVAQVHQPRERARAKHHGFTTVHQQFRRGRWDVPLQEIQFLKSFGYISIIESWWSITAQ